MAGTKPKIDHAHTLAEHVVGTTLEDVPADSLKATRRHVLETFGPMLGGGCAPEISELTTVTGRWGGKEEATLAVNGSMMPAHHTSMVNSAMGPALDFDYTYDKGGHVHPRTSVLAASLAVSESLGGVIGEQLMLAVTLGLDVSYRLGLAAYDDGGWHRTGAFGIFGATATAGKLLGLTQGDRVHAFGIDQINSFDDPKTLAAAFLVQGESQEGRPKGWAEIEVVCAGGASASVDLEGPSGSLDNPLSNEQLQDKFRDCADHVLKPLSGA